MINELFSLKGEVVVVTGGYGHLGSSIVDAIRKADGYCVVLGRSKEKFKNRFGNSDNITFQECDVSSTRSVSKAFEEVYSEYGKISCLINNAFYLKGEDSENISDEEWSISLEGVLGTVHRCIREVLPYMKNQGFGRLINVSSMYGMVAPDFSVYRESKEFTNPPHYGAAKAAVIQLTKYYASALGKENILSNSISPGPFPSAEVLKHTHFIDALAEKCTLGRIGRPEELAGAFVFLASRASSYINGHNLVVDGGWTII